MHCQPLKSTNYSMARPADISELTCTGRPQSLPFPLTLLWGSRMFTRLDA